MNIVKRVFRKGYKILFKNKIEIKNLKEENDKLKYQLDYMKRHSDITLLKPATGLLREYQLKELEFAKEVIALFNKMDIYPFFDGGCLLGAVRHKGFVPWDDDVDLGVMREDFEKIMQIAKEKFIWLDYDNTKSNADLTDLVDKALKENKNQYVFVRTPYCIHCYKGDSIQNSQNCEFFPYDFIKDGITDKQYTDYIESVKKEVVLERPWKDIFAFYDEELNRSPCLTKEKTSRIFPGLGNYAQTQYRFNGFLNYDDIYPLTEIDFENAKIPVPKKYELRAANLYKNWKGYPSDVGISHDMESLKEFMEKTNIPFKEEDFLF